MKVRGLNAKTKMLTKNARSTNNCALVRNKLISLLLLYTTEQPAMKRQVKAVKRQ